MPDSPTQPSHETFDSATGRSTFAPKPDAPRAERPSDTEAAHSQDGGAARDPRLQTDEQRNQGADQNGGNLERYGDRDRRSDYGDAAANGGVDEQTAGARFAEIIPDPQSDPAAGETPKTRPSGA